VKGSELRVQGLRFGVQGSGLRLGVQGSGWGFRIKGSGFRVYSFGLRT
jgi:hypothetical protein